MSLTLLDHITAAVADEYAVLGGLGATPRGSAFLARERAGGHLVVLTVPPSADELTVLGAVSEEVPANAGACTVCGNPPPAFTVFCPQCGRAFVLNTVGAHRFTAAEVAQAAEHAYDILGEVAHQAGGSLFFVRDRADGRLVALAAQADETGGQSLQAVWDALRGDRALVAEQPGAESGVSTYDAPTGFVEPQAYDPAPNYLPDHTGGDVTTGDLPPGYPPEFRDAADLPADEGAPRPRRRWVPVAAAGALVLAAGVAWATMRGPGRGDASLPDSSRVAVPPVDTTPAGPPAGTGGAGTAGVGAAGVGAAGVGAGGTSTQSVTPPPDTARVNTPPPISADSARRLAEARRQADSIKEARRAPAAVTLEGRLPDGWTWTVNGKRGPSSLTARLPVGRPATLIFEAPGYCPETLRLDAPAPGTTQRWTPRLQGKPMVGEC